VTDSSDEDPRTRPPAAPVARGPDVANEVERARTPRTPVLALAGVWVVVAAVFVLVLFVIGLTLYFA
jgi:hypothetical protein